MGQKMSKQNKKIVNNCDLYINNNIELRSYDYQSNNGYYYIYFKSKKIEKDKNYFEFSYLNPNNIIEKDILSFDFHQEKPNNILVKKDKYIEYSLYTDKNRNVKIRLGITNQILYILPIKDSFTL